MSRVFPQQCLRAPPFCKSLCILSSQSYNPRNSKASLCSRGCRLVKNTTGSTDQIYTLYLGDTNLASRWEGVRLPRASGKSPGFPGSSPELPRKFFGDFPGSSLTVELNSNPGVPRKFSRLPRKFPELPRRFPGLPWRSALFSGKPDTLSWLAKTSSEHPDALKESIPKTETCACNTVDAKFIINVSPDNFCVTEVITQNKLIPQELLFASSAGNCKT